MNVIRKDNNSEKGKAVRYAINRGGTLFSADGYDDGLARGFWYHVYMRLIWISKTGYIVKVRIRSRLISFFFWRLIALFR